MLKHKSSLSKRQVSNCFSAYLADRLFDLLRSLLVELDANLDRRLVETFLALVMVILMHRHRNQGLL